MKILNFLYALHNQTKGLVRQKSKKATPSAIALHKVSENRLRVQKYKTAPKATRIFIKKRCRPPPREKPSRKTARPVMSQKRKSSAAVMVFKRVLWRTTRNKSYKKPAAAPRIMEDAA